MQWHMISDLVDTQVKQAHVCQTVVQYFCVAG